MFRYIGGGYALVGVPARDLSADEVKRYGKKRLLASGLYKETRTRQPEPQEPENEQAKE